MKKSEESVEDLGFDVDDVAVNDMPLHEVTTPDNHGNRKLPKS